MIPTDRIPGYLLNSGAFGLPDIVQQKKMPANTNAAPGKSSPMEEMDTTTTGHTAAAISSIQIMMKMLRRTTMAQRSNKQGRDLRLLYYRFKRTAVFAGYRTEIQIDSPGLYSLQIQGGDVQTIAGWKRLETQCKRQGLSFFEAAFCLHWTAAAVRFSA